jgi:hypothetical protein
LRTGPRGGNSPRRRCWPNSPQSTLYNDIAIALFVLDVFLVMAGWPQTSPDESFGEAYAKTPEESQP